MTERIQKQAEEKYLFVNEKADLHTKPKYTFNCIQEQRREAYIAGAESESERYKELVECLEETMKVINVMDELKSSHAYFILQEAWGETITWEDCQKKINKIQQTLNKLNENQ